MDHLALTRRWREREATLCEGGAADVAAIWARAAEELEAFEREHRLEALTLAQAAKESRYSEGHLGRMIADGKIENVGRPGAPRVRRGDLPRKARKAIRRTASGEPDLVGEALAARGINLDP